jgi:hypothetical protein
MFIYVYVSINTYIKNKRLRLITFIAPTRLLLWLHAKSRPCRDSWHLPLLIAAPWILGFSGDRSATIVPIVLGAAAVLYMLLTAYELGLLKVFSMRFHLLLDLASGIILAVSPWLFNFKDQVFLPHLIVGCLEVIVSLTTDATPYGGEWGWTQRRSQRQALRQSQR